MIDVRTHHRGTISDAMAELGANRYAVLEMHASIPDASFGTWLDESGNVM